MPGLDAICQVWEAAGQLGDSERVVKAGVFRDGPSRVVADILWKVSRINAVKAVLVEGGAKILTG